MASQRHACTRLSQIQSPVAAKLGRSANPNPSRSSVPPEKTRRGINVSCPLPVSVVDRTPPSILYLLSSTCISAHASRSLRSGLARFFPSSILHPPSSILHPPSSILYP